MTDCRFEAKPVKLVIHECGRLGPHFFFTKMLLAIDIGNTTASFGLFEGETLDSTFVIPTVREQASEEIYSIIKPDLDSNISEIIISSVVPELEIPFRELFESKYDKTPVFVDNNFDFGFSIKYFPPESCGVDRLIAAFAAKQKYGIPCIVCDFGTATTIDVVNSKNEYIGGIVTPGMKTLADSLNSKTSKLPKTEIAKPEKVIGNTTIGSIQSGVFYGYISLVDGIINRMFDELQEKPKVIATGGFSGLIAKESEFIDFVDRDLILTGIKFVSERLNSG
jgi:type III pantothenate kinase